MNLRRESRERPVGGFEILNNPEARRGLKERVEEIMDRIESERVDAVVFLDRSARPISWLMKEMWKDRESDPPEMKFLNIGYSTNVHSGQHEITKTNEPPPWPLRDHMSPPGVMNRLLGDEWVEEKHVPNIWGEGMLDHADTIQEIEDRFSSHLDGKNVLVLDEYASVGRGLTTAIGALSLALPKVESVRGTAVFISHGRGVEEDRERIPWLRTPGITGVLELPDQSFFSGPITQEGVDKIKETLEKVHEVDFKKLSETFGELLSSISNVKGVLEKLPEYESLESRDKEAVEVVLPQVEDRIKKFLESGSVEDAKAFDSDLYEVSYVFGGLADIFKDSQQGQAIEVIAHLTDQLEACGSVEAIARIEKQLSYDYADIKRLKKRADQLRGEIKQLAHEE
jgi:hypothetical protein